MQFPVDPMNRREALRRAAFLLGGTISAPTLAGVLAGCGRDTPSAKGETTWTPKALSAEQQEMVAGIAEHILPETDTPGARAAGVDRFVDAMLADYYPPEKRQEFLAGLTRMDERAQRAYQKRYLQSTPEQQRELLATIDRATFPPPAATQNAPMAADKRPATQQGDVATGRSMGPGAVSASGGVALDGQADAEDVGVGSFWRNMKELTLVGYYTSEVGATEELRVNPMGTWRADIPFSEVGRGWA